MKGNEGRERERRRLGREETSERERGGGRLLKTKRERGKET
jgi:hypothetical protein